MKRKAGLLGLLFIGLAASVLWPGPLGPVGAQEKLKVGNGFRGAATQDIILWAADEKGFWKRHNLAAEWVAFRGDRPMYQAAAAGSLDMGIGLTAAAIEAISSGVPVKVVAQFSGGSEMQIYVPRDSSIRRPQELKGTKIGVSGIGGSVHAYALAIAKGLGLYGQVRFVAIAGFLPRMAALKAGSLDAVIFGSTAIAELVAKGEVRPVVSLNEFLPKDWSENIIFARTEFASKRPTIVKAAIKALFEAIDFIRRDRAWAAQRLKAGLGFSETVAKMVADAFHPKGAERPDPNALANVQNFLIENGALAKEKAVPPAQLYLSGFVD